MGRPGERGAAVDITKPTAPVLRKKVEYSFLDILTLILVGQLGGIVLVVEGQGCK